MTNSRFEDEDYGNGQVPIRRPTDLGTGFMTRLYDRVTQSTEEMANLPEEDVGEVERYAPPNIRQARATEQEEKSQSKLVEAVQHVVTLHASELDKRLASVSASKRSRNQQIAELIVSLPYREAIAMGIGIAAKIRGVISEETGLSPELLTRAIQDWAWEGDIMRDEERPTRIEPPNVE